MLLGNSNFCAVRDSDDNQADLTEWLPEFSKVSTTELVAELTHRLYTIFTNEDFEAFENRCEEVAQLFAMKDDVKALAACKQLIREITGRILP